MSVGSTALVPQDLECFCGELLTSCPAGADLGPPVYNTESCGQPHLAHRTCVMRLVNNNCHVCGETRVPDHEAQCEAMERVATSVHRVAAAAQEFARANSLPNEFNLFETEAIYAFLQGQANVNFTRLPTTRALPPGYDAFYAVYNAERGVRERPLTQADAFPMREPETPPESEDFMERLSAEVTHLYTTCLLPVIKTVVLVVSHLFQFCCDEVYDEDAAGQRFWASYNEIWG
ncbi:MAG: hypothetical protein SP1CHLAM54_17940 [Chlamydiia bacterium]|nr:hypothetical protein [Chlamydiia bacterium]MCH9616681.1 hypothetical protein [Chlamydiia bacterium]MCH9629412.1 hypothetical protein [Chlamydiia bacterium]